MLLLSGQATQSGARPCCLPRVVERTPPEFVFATTEMATACFLFCPQNGSPSRSCVPFRFRMIDQARSSACQTLTLSPPPPSVPCTRPHAETTRSYGMPMTGGFGCISGGCTCVGSIGPSVGVPGFAPRYSISYHKSNPSFLPSKWFA